MRLGEFQGAMSQVAQQESSEPEPDAVRVIGKVKWFDTVKGYGFIVPDSSTEADLEGDVLLHITALRSYGQSFAVEGARLVADAVIRDRGWQAVNIIELDTPRSAGEVAFTLVTVKWFNKTKGYGFVRTEDSDEDVFVHAVVTRNVGLEHLEPGDQFLADVQQGSKGKHVAAAKPAPANG